MLAKHQITVDRQKLLEHLRKNRERHISQHREAMQGYRLEAADYLTKMQTELKNNPNKFDHNKILKDLKRPKFYGNEYTCAIDMLEWSTADQVTIDRHQFENWVQDRWGWKREWLIRNSFYRSRVVDNLEEEEWDDNYDDDWE